MKVVVLSGPTASGKTDLAIELAQKYGGEVVNFDSLLLYKEINIGTAKPTLKERSLVPHHLIDVVSIAHPMNASDYAKEAHPIIEKLLGAKKFVYLVGGSGFYLQALLKGMYDSPTTPQSIMDKSEHIYQDKGIAPFIEVLRENDPASLKQYHENDHYRIRRAVEHFWANGTPLSAMRAKKNLENSENADPSVHGWDILHIHLDLPKEEHQKIIEARTDKMLESGLIKEVDDLLALGFKGSEKPLQCIGYKEILELKFGILENLKACRDRIVISTRQLAKSQRTWFNRIPGKKIFHPLNERQQIFERVEEFLKS